MSSTIPTHYVIGFNSGIRLLQQQMASRFRGAVSVDTAPQIEGKRAAYDQIDATVMVAITDRHGPTQVTDDTHARRWVTFTPAEKASLIDRADMRRILNNPVNDYTRSHKSAADRFLDDKIIGAFFATAISLLSYLVPQEQVAEFDPRAGGREGEDGAVAGENEDA